MRDNSKKIFLVLLLALVILPIFADAQVIGSPPPIIPDCTKSEPDPSPECGFKDLIQLANNLVNWVIWISFPIAAGVFAWAGIKYMTTGVADQKKQANEMMQKVFWGFVFILSAWIIVSTITSALLDSDFRDIIQ